MRLQLVSKRGQAPCHTQRFPKYSALDREPVPVWKPLPVVILLIGAAAACSPSSAVGDIFRWDTGQLIPGTERFTPAPSVKLNNLHLEYADLADLDLNRADFSNATLSDADLSGSILRFATFFSATLIDTNLSDTDLRNTLLHETTLTGAIFSNADLTDATLRDSMIMNADLSGANLTDASLNFTVLTNANLSGAVIRGAKLQTTTYFGLTEEMFRSTASFQVKDLQGIDLSRNEMDDWDFTDQNLSGSILSNTFLRNADFSGANLEGARFEVTRLQNADFRGANLANARLIDAEMAGADLNGANLTDSRISNSVLTGVDLSGANLTRAGLGSDLTGANLNQAILTGASLGGATLTSVDFSGARVTGANLYDVTSRGFTQAQLQSTASYQDKDLRNIVLSSNDLTGWDLSGQDLSGAALFNASVGNVDFTNAVITGGGFGRLAGLTQAQIQSTANYQAGNLEGISLAENDLTNWDFSGLNLTGTRFNRSTLTNTDLSGAIITDAGFGDTTSRGFTLAQLQSTASYQAKDLYSLDLFQNDLTGWDFSDQNLTRVNFGDSTLRNADFSGAIVIGAGLSEVTASGFTESQLQSTASYQAKNLYQINLTNNNLSGWDFSGQYLANASFFGSTMTNVDLTGADLRGANVSVANFPRSPNMISSEGRIDGLALTDGDSLVVRNHTRIPTLMRDPIPILVEHHLTMDETGRLQIVFNEEPWHSTISFSPRGIPVVLGGGTLELNFADGVDVASQLGRTLDVFDWTGVNRFGEFNVDSPYLWDTSSLYSTGEVRLTGTGGAGDYDLSGIVNQGDLDIVLVNWGSDLSDPFAAGWTNDVPLGPIDQGELDKVLINWGKQYSSPGVAAVPEPATWVSMLACLGGIVAIVRRGPVTLPGVAGADRLEACPALGPLAALGAFLYVRLQDAEGLLVSLDGHGEGVQEPFGRIVIRDDPLVDRDGLGRRAVRLGVQAEVDN